MLPRNSTSFLINNMFTTYTYQKFCSAPTPSLEIQVSHKLCINPKSLIISSKRTFQLQMLTPVLRRIAGASIPFSILRIDKTFLIVSHTTFPYEIHSGMQF